MNKQLDSLMQKEMSRKEFLVTLGFGLASVMGLSSIIHMLTGKSPSSYLHRASGGYGSTAYGGGKD